MVADGRPLAEARHRAAPARWCHERCRPADHTVGLRRAAVTTTLALVLVGLALIDSTSFGTLLIPLWLLLAPGRLRAGRIGLYLATVAGFYLVVGALLFAGASVLIDGVIGLVESVPPAPLRVGQLAAGAGLFWWSYRIEANAKRARGRPGRLTRWRARATSGTGGHAALVGLALLATTLEVATMVPYLAAIGLLANAELAWPMAAAALAGYCLVMIAPALVLTAGRAAAHRRIDPLLQRLDSWLSRHSATALSWTVGALGVWMFLNALANLTFGGA